MIKTKKKIIYSFLFKSFVNSMAEKENRKMYCQKKVLGNIYVFTWNTVDSFSFSNLKLYKYEYTIEKHTIRTKI